MIIWLEEAYGIDESYEAMCQILATDDDGIVFLEIDLAGLKEMAGTVSFQPDADLITPLWRKIEAILDCDGREGHFSASIIELEQISTSTGVARKSRHNGRELCTRMADVVDMAGPLCLLPALWLENGSSSRI